MIIEYFLVKDSMDKFEDTIEEVENSQEKLVEDSIDIVEDSIEVIQDSLEIVEVIQDSVKVVQDSEDENEPQWLRDKPNVVRSMLKILLPKFYYEISLPYLYELEIFGLNFTLLSNFESFWCCIFLNLMIVFFFSSSWSFTAENPPQKLEGGKFTAN